MDEYHILLERRIEQLKEEVHLYRELLWLAADRETKQRLSPFYPDRQVPDAVSDARVVQRTGLG